MIEDAALDRPLASASRSTWIAGVDGFKSQWCVVLQDLESNELRVRIAPTFASLLAIPERPQIVAVDIPIGLPDFALPGGRACEREARRVLGRRASSVFSAVGRRALEQPTRIEAQNASRAAGGLGVAAQAWGLAAKLREADSAMTPDAQRVVHEVHPEVSFWAMNDRVPIACRKKSPEGERARQDALIRAGFPDWFIMGMAADLRVGRDDFLDACAALWTAARIASGNSERLPTNQDLDARGLDQAIWF